ncbi:MAG: hypothetical protein ISS81_05330 [Candidatus Marinimicrobia bacterium]|nr:hypothetical protein [Candidatus Neomarinimicrobiota bacterium]
MKSLKQIINPILMVMIMTSPILSVKIMADTSDKQMEQINRDIEIMENVLDKLIIKESPFYFNFDDHVRGIYLDGFGLLFDVESFGLNGISRFISKTISKIPNINITHDKGKRVRIDIDEDEYIHAEEADKSARYKIDKTKELLFKFYRDYASSIKSLNPDDRICVNIRLRNDFGFISYNDEEKVPSQIRMSALASDLAKFRRGKLSKDKLQKKIKFTEIYGDDNDRDVEIMERILDTALEKDELRKIPGLSGHTRGLYLDDFGILFFSPTSLLEKNIKVFVKNASEAEKRAEQAEKRAKEYEKRVKKYKKRVGSDKDSLSFSFTFNMVDFDFDFHRSRVEIDSIVNKIRDDLLELLGQYSHTLKKVKDNEWIMIAVDLNDRFWNEDLCWLYIKVKKSDVIKYNREEINFNSFKKRVKVWRG